MEARVLYRGQVWTMYLLAEGDREFAREFVNSRLTKVQQDQMKALLRRSADQGLPSNTAHFHTFSGYEGLGEFKRFGVRLMCFFDGPGRIVLTHGFKKKSDDLDPQQIKRAVRMREAYWKGEAQHER
jgi:hypothetical protein